MNIFAIKTTWSNAEFIPLKVSIATAYVAIGTYFQGFFRHYYGVILVLFAITTVWTLTLWFTKMKQRTDETGTNGPADKNLVTASPGASTL